MHNAPNRLCAWRATRLSRVDTTHPVKTGNPTPLQAVLSISLLLALALRVAAAACSCITSGPPCQAAGQFSAVFLGTVDQLKIDGMEPDEHGMA